jgi:tetratricopeptide (TPR) repeat protein
MIFIGDSHIRAMAHGFMRLSATERALVEAVCGPVRFAMVGPAYSFGDRFWNPVLDGVSFVDPLGSRLASTLGVEGSIILQDDPRRFIFSMPFQPSLIYRAHIAKFWITDTPTGDLSHITHAAFRAAVLHYNRHILDFFTALRGLNVIFSVLQSPPPSLLYSLTKAFGQRAIDFLRLHDQIINSALEARQISSEAPPDIVRVGSAKDGYLRQALHDTSSEGSPHGNGQYGELFLRKIFAEQGLTELALTKKDETRLSAELSSPSTQLEWDMRLAFSLANRRIDAVSHFSDILRRAPRDRRALFGSAYALERAGRIEEAEIKFALVTAEFPEWPPGWMGLARVQFANQRMFEAADTLSRARALGVDSPDWYLRYGAVLEKLARLDEARNILRTALFDQSDSGEPILKNQWLENDARLSTDGFFPAQTVHEPNPFDRAASAPIQAGPYLVVLGRVELASGNVDSAEQCFLLARDLPSWQGTWNSYLGDISIRRKNWLAAETFYSAAAKAAPEVAIYALRLGLSLEHQQRHADARELYLQAIKAHPKNTALYEALCRTSLATS